MQRPIAPSRSPRPSQSPLPPLATPSRPSRPQATSSQAAQMYLLQDIITGKSSAAVTPLVLHDFFSLSYSSELAFLFLQGLKKDKVSPTDAIVQLLSVFHKREQLIMLSFCLRYGADVNTYVNVPQVGTVHLLGYCYLTLDVSDELLGSIIALLVLSGSKYSMPMFQGTPSKRYDLQDMISASRSISRMGSTVLQWLETQGYQTDLLLKVAEKRLNSSQLTEAGILLDRPELLSGKLGEEDIEESIMSHSNDIAMAQLASDTTRPYPLDHRAIMEAVKYLNSEVFLFIVTQGMLPSYVLVNQMLLKLKEYKKSEYVMCYVEVEKMLLDSVNYGYIMDREQLNIVAPLGKDSYEALLQAYSDPYWKKTCRIRNSETPARLKNLALGVSLPPESNKNYICENLVRITQADPSKLKEALILRHQEKLAARLGTITEFIGNKSPLLACRNHSQLAVDISDIADIDIDFYRDDEGFVYCFTSDMFIDLLESGVNPYTSKKLPESFMQQLKVHLQELKRLGLNKSGRELITFSGTLELLEAADKVSNEESERAVDAFMRLAQMYYVQAGSLQDLTREQMEQVLRNLGISVSLQDLTINHAFITFVRIGLYEVQQNPQMSGVLFDSIKLALRS